MVLCSVHTVSVGLEQFSRVTHIRDTRFPILPLEPKHGDAAPTRPHTPRWIQSSGYPRLHQQDSSLPWDPKGPGLSELKISGKASRQPVEGNVSDFSTGRKQTRIHRFGKCDESEHGRRLRPAVVVQPIHDDSSRSDKPCPESKAGKGTKHSRFEVTFSRVK